MITGNRLILLIVMLFAGLALGFQSAGEEADSGQARALPEGPLTLDQLVEFALANNPDVAAAGHDVHAAEARRDRAAGGRLPNVSARGSYDHHLDPQKMLPVSGPGEPMMFSRDLAAADIVLTIPLYTGGRLKNQVSAAELLQESAEHRLARTREELAFNVSSLYYSILYQRHAIESIEFSREVLREHLERIKYLVEMRKAPPVDQSRVEVAIADLDQKMLSEKNVMSVKDRALTNLLGLPRHSGPLPLHGDLEIEESVPLPDLETAWRRALAQREDYLALESEVQALESNVKIAEAGRWPEVNLYGAYGGRWALGETYGEADKAGDLGRIGVNVSIPLYDGGQVESQIRENQAKLAAGRERLRKLKLQVRLEVESALLKAQSSQERIQVTRRAVSLARENLEIERQKYEMGKGVIVDVLDSQAALLGAENNYYRAVADFNVAKAQLRLAMGEKIK